MKTFFKKFLVVLSAVIGALAVFVGGAVIYSLNYSVPEQAAFM